MNEHENESLRAAPRDFNVGPNTESGKRGSVLRAIGAAAGWLALYFGIRYALSLLLVTAYAVIWTLLLGPDTAYEQLTSAKIGEITFLEIILSTIAIFSAVLIIYLIRDRKYPRSEKAGFRRGTGFRKIRFSLIPILTVLGFTLNLTVSLAFDILPIPEELIADYIEQSSALGETSPLSVIATTIFAPLSEELIFRGLLVSSLGSAMPTWSVLLISSAIFGLIHGQILWICYAFLLGLYLGFIRIRTGSTAASFLLHAAFNASSFILPLLPIPNDASLTTLLIIAAMALGASALLSVLIMYLTKKQSPRRA